MQAATHKQVPKMLSERQRLVFGFVSILILVLVLAGTASIPFFFESSSILYKFGFNRILLLTGQVMGLVAGCLLLVQVILAARLKFLDQVWGLDRLFKFHRINGIITAALVIIHPLVIFIADDRISIPLQWRYWPEFVGLFLMLLIVIMVVTSCWRIGLGLAFHRWWPIHRTAAIIAVVAFGVHVLSVNDTFEQRLPQVLAIVALILCGLIFLWIRTRIIRNRRKPLRVAAVEAAAADAVCLKLVADDPHLPAHLPGQFGFFSLSSEAVASEEHPFTIASSPTEADGLEIIVRTSGDWTAQLKHLQPQDRVLMDGPYGLFSHLRAGEQKEIIMIAGGIGITPMLSMLRYMADHNEPRSITLIWSNQSPEHIVLPYVFEKLAARLNRLRVVHVMTRTAEYTGEQGRLDRPALKRLLSDCSRTAAVFVCGSDQMMKAVRSWLVSLGFERRMVFMEHFNL
ncbi:MAG: ferric reductase-like transmembrane domain-containing protein [Deltaproteobacteria bacterium]|nr:ferric reductase-like transmembrane domain-containing protein [Deltaproteobacteria bacterium]